MLSRCVEEGCGRLMRTCLSSNKTKEFNEGKRTNRQVSSDGRAKYGEGEGGRRREKEGEGGRRREKESELRNTCIFMLADERRV